MNAFLQAYPYIVLSFGLLAAVCTLSLGMAGLLVSIWAEQPNDHGARLLVSGLSITMSFAAAAAIITLTRWLLLITVGPC